MKHDSIAIHPDFQKRIDEIRAMYFSRNPKLWPIYNDPGLAEILRQTSLTLPEDQRFETGPIHDRLLDKMMNDREIPQHSRTPSPDNIDPLLLFSSVLSKQWNNPSSVENVVTMPSDPAIYGCMMAAMVNPNLVCSAYSMMAGKLEKLVVRRIASLVGYDPDRAGGLFTQGGTFCNMYGYLFGLRKVMKDTEAHGFDSLNNYRFICSQGGHYSNYTTLSVMGANIAEKNIRIKIDNANRMDMDDLERQLVACYQLGCKVPTIMLTMGTTDTFGTDRVKPVYDLVDRLHRRFSARLPKPRQRTRTDMPDAFESDEKLVKPHIHVDSAIGWALLFFLDYNFRDNPLAINEPTLERIFRLVEDFRELKYADSFSVDFHKWGYVPYTSSLVMVKDDASFTALEHDPEYYSYFDRSEMAHTHLQSTIEASRGGQGIFGAYAALEYLGVEGFQILVANTLQNSLYFRSLIEETPGAVLLTRYNHGPSVTFRLYNPSEVSDAQNEWQYEMEQAVHENDLARLKRNSDYHRNVFLNRRHKHLYTSWVEFAAHSNYDETGKYLRIPGEKAVFFNPLTSCDLIDSFVRTIREL